MHVWRRSRHPAVRGSTDRRRPTHEILETSGVQGGLIVHVGCGDGKLTAALRANDSFLVHGLDTDAKTSRQPASTSSRWACTAPVSVQPWAGERLPYVDNLVNLIVVSDQTRVPREELLRVLVPDGVAIFLIAKSESPI